MKKLNFYIILIILLYSCSNSESGENNLNNFIQKDITIIAKNNNQFYQIDILNNSENINTTNLSETLGIENNYRVLNTSPSLITFFKSGGYNFPVFQKNIITSEIYTLNQYCGLDSQEGLLFPTNSNKKLILFTYEPYEDNGSVVNIFIRIYNKQTENCEKLLIGPGLIDSQRSTIVNDENIFVYYINEENKYVIVKINLNTNQIEEELVFDNAFRATLSDNNLHIFFYNNEYEIYNTSNFELINKSTLDVSGINESSGFFETHFSGNEMLFKFYYAQPSTISYGPATIDLTTGEVTRGFGNHLFDIKRNLEDQLKASIGITTYNVELQNNLIIIGIRINNVNGNSGGIVYSNFEGKILEIVELDFEPSKIIIR